MRHVRRAVASLLGLTSLLVTAPTSAAIKESVDYRLSVDAADLSAFTVEMRIEGAPTTLRLAMPVHPEYDERSWRFLEALSVSAGGARARLTREDSTLWRVDSRGGTLMVRYRMRVPGWEANRAAWRPFLSPTGGLTGGPYLFLYVVGREGAPATVTLDLPAGWAVATGLDRTADPRTFRANSADHLADSPILVGRFSRWDSRPGV